RKLPLYHTTKKQKWDKKERKSAFHRQNAIGIQWYASLAQKKSPTLEAAECRYSPAVAGLAWVEHTTLTKQRKEKAILVVKIPLFVKHNDSISLLLLTSQVETSETSVWHRKRAISLSLLPSTETSTMTCGSRLVFFRSRADTAST
ncbi:hypothetical protein HAX54_045719, partial [Datura stramonium]|nr:hypothetical protein [Datura stramonium]